MKLILYTITLLLVIGPMIGSVAAKNDDDEGLSNVINKGWMKYFMYYPTKKDGNAPKAFFINAGYEHQFSGGRVVNQEETDDLGEINIPNKFRFWFVLTKEALYITSARRNDMAKTVDVI